MGAVRYRVVVLVALASLVAGLSVSVAPPALAGTVINVPSSRPTIQAGIDAASNGDTVVVAPGFYVEHIDFKGKAIEVSSAQPRMANIDGGGTGPVVLFRSGEGRASTLKGFYITNGALPVEGGPGVIAGAGIAIVGSSPTIVGNGITMNDARGHAGAGIGAVSGSPLIQDNWIYGNDAGASGAGGGIFVGDGAEIVGNLIEGNNAGGGGGLMISGGTPVVRNNYFSHNRAGMSHGGAVSIRGSGGVVVGNVMKENVADGSGGAIHWESTGTANVPYVVNNTLLDNEALTGSAVAAQSGGARLVNNIVSGQPGTSLVWCSAGSAPAVTFSHNDVYNATPAPYEGCADATGADGNISAEPDLEEYRPTPPSPLVDAGDSDASYLEPTDFLGEPRVTDGDGDGVDIVDIGAAEAAGIPKLAGDGYHPLTPARILDTRTGLVAPVAKVGPGETMTLQVSGRGGVPADGVTAVTLNMAVTEPTETSWLSAWPAGTSWPGAANLNYVAGQTVANAVVVKVGEGGRISLLNSSGSTHVIADVVGWYSEGLDGARYTALPPNRILDTRSGHGAPFAQVGAGETLALQVTGQGGVPDAGVTAVVLNVAVTGPQSEGWLTAWPAGEARPHASSLNYAAGQTVPNLVVVKVGVGGKVDLFSSGGPTDIVADVAGWFGADGVAGGSGFASLVPARILDTRLGVGSQIGPLRSYMELQVTGRGGVPASGVSAVVLNVTVTEPAKEGWLSLWPVGGSSPLASNLNFVAGQTVPNLVVVKVGYRGRVGIDTSAWPVHVIVDVAGWYLA